MTRWSGYGTQSEPWRNGYDWGHDLDDLRPVHHAADDFGYEPDTPDYAEFEKGIDFALEELAEE